MKPMSGQLSLIRCFSLLLLFVTIVGCGKKDGTVSGKVTYKGAPVTGGFITFEPTNGVAAKGDIKPDGTYKVSGVPPGDNKVVIDTEMLQKMAGMMNPAKMGGDSTQPPPEAKDKGAKTPTAGDLAGVMPVYVKIPDKYSKKSTTPLDLKVGGGSQKKDFDLTD